MAKVGNFLVVFITASALFGRGPAVFGLVFGLLIPAGLLLVLIGALYPEGMGGFAERACQTIVRGFH
jgi:hypothetical protein